MPARVAAQLQKEDGVQVETAKGGLGEFSVSINDRKVIETNRLWYPVPRKIVEKVRGLLAGCPL